MELRAYQAYRAPELPITFWRTSAGQEVDFLVGDRELALEIKGSARVHEGDLRSLLALLDDGPVKHCIVVCLEREPRWIHQKIEVLPWRLFLERLWGGRLC